MLLEDFYAEDERRRTHGSQQFGFNWKDPSVTDWNCYCEVHWYYGTHEIAAVYQTVDPQRLVAAVAHGSASTTALQTFSKTVGPAVGPVVGPAVASDWSAIGIGQMLGNRDQATAKTEVRVLGLLEHPIDRWWVLRDAMHIELEPDGLAILQRRIDEVDQGERSEVVDHSFHTAFLKACRLGPDENEQPPAS
jgi:hypothetical protein